MNMAVLGRGSSVKEYAQHASKFSQIYLSNTFNEEIEAIGKIHFKGKDLVHVQGPAYSQSDYEAWSDVLKSKDRFHNLDLYDLFSSVRILKNNNKMEPSMMQRGYRATTTWQEILEKSQNEKDHQTLLASLDDEKHREKFTEWKERVGKLRKPVSGRTWPTIGMFAIEHALSVAHPDELSLFGFDFFEADYMPEGIGPIQHKYKTTTLAAMMKYHLEQLIREFSQTQFHIFTASKTFTPNYPNCTLTFL